MVSQDQCVASRSYKGKRQVLVLAGPAPLERITGMPSPTIAEVLARRLADFADGQDEDDASEASEDHFRITRVEPGRIWLEGLDGHERGPIPLPTALSRQCPVGWTISGVVGRVGRRWQLLEA